MQRAALRGPHPSRTVKSAAPEGCRRSPDRCKVERRLGEQYLEARTDGGARADARQPAPEGRMRQPTGDRLRTPRRRERCNESEPRSPAAIEHRNKWLGRSPREPIRSNASEAAGVEVRSGADAAIRERRTGVGEKSDGADRRCRACSLRNARSGRKVAGLRAMFRPRRRKAQKPSRLRFAATKMPRERNGAPERRPRSEPLEAFRHQPASGRCGVSPLEWGGRDADSTAGKIFSPKKSGDLATPGNLTCTFKDVHPPAG